MRNDAERQAGQQGPERHVPARGTAESGGTAAGTPVVQVAERHVGLQRILGIFVLVAGVVALALWARADHAPRIEADLSQAAATAVGFAVHGVEARVSGRDITVTGLADGAAERDRIVATLDAIPGRRAVTDRLDVLPTAYPFAFAAEKPAAEAGDAPIAVRGNVPTEPMRARLADEIGAEAAATLELAAGVPDAGWNDAVMAGVHALDPLASGRFELSERALRLSGVARTPLEAAAAEEALAALPEGYAAATSFELLDDGTPPDYRLEYNAERGAVLRGKLPAGFETAGPAAALGLASVTNEARMALDDGTDRSGRIFAALRPWLPQIETMTVVIAEAGNTVTAAFAQGTDLELVTEDLEAAIAGEAALALSLAPPQPEGATRERVNAASGQNERLVSGYWLPVREFSPDRATCAREATAVLEAHRINFLSGTARLDADALAAVNALSSVMLLCTRNGGLRAEIGGHTDAIGTDAENFRLSRARAQAVAAALVARGVPAGAMIATGYGATEPVADDGTDEGRAENRRITLRWLN